MNDEGVLVKNQVLEMPKKDPAKKKASVKLPDLAPKEDARGGKRGYFSSRSLSIPPPGFVSSSEKSKLESNGLHARN